MIKLSAGNATEFYDQIHRICTDNTLSSKHRMAELRLPFESMFNILMGDRSTKGLGLIDKMNLAFDSVDIPEEVVRKAHSVRITLNKYHHASPPEALESDVFSAARDIVGIIYIFSDLMPDAKLSAILGFAGVKPSDLNEVLDILGEFLSEPQLAAACSNNIVTIIQAGAGTGKTHMLKFRAIYLCLKLKEEGEKGLYIITYTNKAAFELKSRIFPALLSLGLFPEKLFIGTIHSFAYSFILDEPQTFGLSNNTSLLDDEEDTSAIESAAALHRVYDKKLIRDLKSKLTLDSAYTDGHIMRPKFSDVQEKIIRAYETFKKEHDLISFDDILTLFNSKLNSDSGYLNKIRSAIDCLLVDEFQDVSAIQAEVFLMLINDNMSFTCVGDELQSIFLFRGAEPDVMNDFVNSYPQSLKISMLHNHRATQPILDFVNQLDCSPMQNKVLESSEKTGAKPFVAGADTQESEAVLIVSMIEKLIRENVNPSAIAVLSRFSVSAESIKDLLQIRKIPYYSVGGMQEMKPHIRDVIAVLKIAGNVKHPICWERLMNKTGMKQLYSLNKISSLNPKMPLLQQFELSVPPEKKPGLLSVFSRKKDNAGLSPEQNFRKVVSLIDNLRSSEEIAGIIAEILDWYREAVPRSDGYDVDFSNLMSLVFNETDLRTLLSTIHLRGHELGFYNVLPKPKEDHIKVSTVHSAKGLEWDHVFVMDANDDTYPAFTTKQLSDGPGTVEKLRLQHYLAEDKRTLYVALTRAKKCLYISYPKKVKSFSKQKSRFLTTISESFYTRIN